MKFDELKRYLERFYQGETTAEEERVLEDFLLSGQAGEEWAADAELFDSIRAARNVFRTEKAGALSDADIDRSRSRLEESISAWEKSGQQTGNGRMKKQEPESVPESESGKKRIRRHGNSAYRLLGGIAAAVVLAVGTGLYMNGKFSLKTPDSESLCPDGFSPAGTESLALVDTYTDPAQARAAADEALKKFAEVLQKSKSDLGNAGEKGRKWSAKMNRVLDF